MAIVTSYRQGEVRDASESTHPQQQQQQQQQPLFYSIPGSISIIPPLYILYRIYMVQYMPIMDCDEIYNYWEPIHFLLYQTGFQTWEYHYVYALRTYAYLLPLKLFTQLYTYILSITTNSSTVDKTILFLTLRQSIAAMTACCELFFLCALLRYYHYQGRSKDRKDSNSNSNREKDLDAVANHTVVPYMTAILLLTCTGMNHAASALLPSATYISIWCTCTGCFLLQYHTSFIIVAIIGTLTTGWPFGCICILPMAIHIVYKELSLKRQPLKFITYIIVTTIIVQSIVTWIDTIHYGSITFPTLNIFIYNAGQSNDTLYGVEPLSYYIKNLFLNCNFMSFLGCLAIPTYLLFSMPFAAVLASKLVPSSSQQQKQQQHSMARYDANIVSILLSLPIWFMITLPRPHKEERFMYPIYPVLIYGSVLTVDILLSSLLRTLMHKSRPSSPDYTNVSKNYILRWKTIGHVCICIPILLLSSSRTFALYKYYHAPIDVYHHLSDVVTKSASSDIVEGNTTAINTTNTTELVCTCGEWYRFMSSFYLPESGAVSIPIGFLPSSFKGQLPQPFSQYGSKHGSLQHIQPFNDQNEEVIDRYVKNISQCKYLIDVSDSNDCRIQLETPDSNVMLLYAVPFLDTDRTAVLHRILYIPYMHERGYRDGHVTYKNYTLHRIENKKD